MGDWLQFEEGSRSYRVAGLEALRSDLIRASGELARLIHDRYRSCGEVLSHFYGRPAREFAARANAMLAAMVDLDGALTEAARLLGRFPEDRMLLARVPELGRSRGAKPPRVEPPPAAGHRVGIDVDAVRRYVATAGGAEDRLDWLARQAGLDGVEAMEARRPGRGGLLGPVPLPWWPLTDEALEWDRIPAAPLVPIPDLIPLARVARSHSRAAAELALATAEAFARADAELVALLDRHPDLSGYVTAAFARRLNDSPVLVQTVAGADGVLTRRDVLRHQADMRAYATAWEHLRLFDTAAKGGKPDGRTRGPTWRRLPANGRCPGTSAKRPVSCSAASTPRVAAASRAKTSSADSSTGRRSPTTPAPPAASSSRFRWPTTVGRAYPSGCAPTRGSRPWPTPP